MDDESQVCHQLSAAWCCSKSRPTVVSLCFVADMFVRFEIASEKRPLVRHVANLQERFGRAVIGPHQVPAVAKSYQCLPWHLS